MDGPRRQAEDALLRAKRVLDRTTDAVYIPISQAFIANFARQRRRAAENCVRLLNTLIEVVVRDERAADAAHWYWFLVWPITAIRQKYLTYVSATLQTILMGLVLAGQICLSGWASFDSSSHTTIWLKSLYTGVVCLVACIAAVVLLFSTELPKM